MSHCFTQSLLVNPWRRLCFRSASPVETLVWMRWTLLPPSPRLGQQGRNLQALLHRQNPVLGFWAMWAGPVRVLCRAQHGCCWTIARWVARLPDCSCLGWNIGRRETGSLGHSQHLHKYESGRWCGASRIVVQTFRLGESAAKLWGTKGQKLPSGTFGNKCLHPRLHHLRSMRSIPCLHQKHLMKRLCGLVALLWLYRALERLILQMAHQSLPFHLLRPAWNPFGQMRGPWHWSNSPRHPLSSQKRPAGDGNSVGPKSAMVPWAESDFSSSSFYRILPFQIHYWSKIHLEMHGES